MMSAEIALADALRGARAVEVERQAAEQRAGNTGSLLLTEPAPMPGCTVPHHSASQSLAVGLQP